MSPQLTSILENARAQLGQPLWFNDDLNDTFTLIEAQRRRIAELENLATKDELTGLSNRRGLNAAISTEAERIARGQSNGAMMVVIDLNDFKALNDTFGHEAGDLALKAVAATLLSFIRTTDHAARIGGDEFVLLLTHTTPSQMVRRIQVLEQALNGLMLDWHGRTLTLSASLGSATLSTGLTNVQDLFAAADKAMYAAKAAKKKPTKASVAKGRFTAPAASAQSSSERIPA